MTALTLVPNPAPPPMVESIPLAEAYLCVNCECVMRIKVTGRCVVCDSDAVLPLYRALGEREEVDG